eukprot:scaffold28659_cov59-Phaeocystis_antarctica.AAC.4
MPQLLAARHAAGCMPRPARVWPGKAQASSRSRVKPGHAQEQQHCGQQLLRPEHQRRRRPDEVGVAVASKVVRLTAHPGRAARHLGVPFAVAGCVHPPVGRVELVDEPLDPVGEGLEHTGEGVGELSEDRSSSNQNVEDRESAEGGRGGRYVAVAHGRDGYDREIKRVDRTEILCEVEDEEAEQERQCGRDERRGARPAPSYSLERMEAGRKHPGAAAAGGGCSGRPVAVRNSASREKRFTWLGCLQPHLRLLSVLFVSYTSQT